MHRLRLSSEGPEVVAQIPDKFFVPYMYKSPRSALYQKPPSDSKSQIPLYPLRLSRDESSLEIEASDDRSCGGRTCSLLLTIILVILAFLLGGGIGGGIGGAFIAKDHAKIASLTSSLAVLPTVTLPPASTPTTCVVDQAGCPNINNVPYTSSGSTFIQKCEMNIISKTADSIDISSSIQTSWKACMNSCADFNKNVKKGGCQGATWQLFSTSNPSDNSKCTLKSSSEVVTFQPSGDQLCSGVLQS